MKRRNKIILAISGLWLFVMVATFPELMAAWKERPVVEQLFSRYADALVNQNFGQAYAYQSPEFQEAISLASFVQYQRDAQAKLGPLQSVRQEGITVGKWRNPTRWQAIVVADFKYAKAKIRFTFVLHRDSDHWTIFSSSGTEK
jgi:hypothetical protein